MARRKNSDVSLALPPVGDGRTGGRGRGEGGGGRGEGGGGRGEGGGGWGQETDYISDYNLCFLSDIFYDH